MPMTTVTLWARGFTCPSPVVAPRCDRATLDRLLDGCNGRRLTRCPAYGRCERLRFYPALLRGCGSSRTHGRRRARMYLHANAKLGLAGRLALVGAIDEGLSLRAAAAAFR